MVTKIYLCPSDKKYGCSWEGSSEDILDHFIQEHEDLLYNTNLVNVNLDVKSENCLIFVDTEIYLFQAKIIDNYLCVFLRYLGPANIAEKITFDIDLFHNDNKLNKNDIQIKNGYFSVSVKKLLEYSGDINKVHCQILISGDFRSNSSDDGVFLEDEASLGKGQINERGSTGSITKISDEIQTKNFSSQRPHLDIKPTFERYFSFDSSDDTTPNLEDLFASAKDTNSPDDSNSSRPKSIEDGSRTKWYEALSFLFREPEAPKSEPLLQRSKTFGSEDLKKRNTPKRHPSMRSLDAIRESDLEIELRCLNCDSHLAPPIFVCMSNHNICANCYRDHINCTVCKSKITADRNLELEEKSIEYLYVCKNKKNGCPQKLSYQEICEHEINCCFCFYVCPVEECGYKAGYKSMFSHLNLIHSSVKMFESFIAVFQKHTEVFLTNEKMGIFYCTIKVLDDSVVWKAKFCGPKERKFFCELKFKGKSFKYPLLLVKHDDYYIKEIPTPDLKEHKVKPKNSILTITR